jgi:alpha-amylase
MSSFNGDKLSEEVNIKAPSRCAAFVCLSALFLFVINASAEKGGDGRIDKTDSCYFVVVDRFFNGDSPNDNQGFGEFDPARPSFYHGGDWKGLQQKLDYIKGMGFTCLYITPVVDNWKGSYVPSDRHEPFTSYHGYHAFDVTKPNLNFGTWADLSALISAAHAKAIDVMIDQVYNHMSPVEVISDLNQYPGFDSTEFHNCTTGCTDETRNLFNLADLDTGQASVREKLATQHTGYYNAVNADGMRLDTVRHIAPSEWGDILTRVRNKIFGSAREFTLGEVFETDGSDENIATVTGQYTKPPANLDSVLNFLLYRAIRDFQNSDAGKLGSVRHWQLTQNKFKDPFSLGNFVDNHDVPRFLCQHNNNWAQLKQALSVAMFWPGFPIIYYGTEQGANGCNDPDNREDMWRLGGPSFSTSAELYLHLKRLNAVRNSENVPGLTFTNGKAGSAVRNGTVFTERWVGNCLYAFERKTPDSSNVALMMLNACGSWEEMTNLKTEIGPGWKQETIYGFKWINPDGSGTVASYWIAPYETLAFEN